MFVKHFAHNHMIVHKVCITIFMLSLIMLFCTYQTRKILSGYDQEIPQSQTTDNPMAPDEKATQHSRDTRKTN